MAITITSGGFDGTMRSDADGNIFIETTGNSKTINIGGLIEYTGSVVKTLDKGTGKVIDSKESILTTGKTFHRSASATSNQIEFLQSTIASQITLSGSGVNAFVIVGTAGASVSPGSFQRKTTAKGDFIIQGTKFLSTGMDNLGNYYISPNSSAAIGAASFEQSLMVSASKDVFMNNNLTVGGIITAHEFHTQVTSASIMFYSGSTKFGDTQDDIHNFTGSLRQSGSTGNHYLLTGNTGIGIITPTEKLQVEGNITSSGVLKADTGISSSNGTFTGTITAEQITSTDDMTVTDDLNVQGQINLATDIVHTLDADTKIAFATDRITLTAGGVDMIDLREASPDSITFGAAISSHITASGNISSSGIIYGKQRYYTHHGYNANNTDNVFIPLGLALDGTSNQYYQRWLAPYDGRLVKILSRGEGACDVASHGFATASNGTEDPVLVASTQVGIDMDTADTTFEFVMSSSTCQFNKGDSLAIMFEPASAGGLMNTTVVWEYKVND